MSNLSGSDIVELLDDKFNYEITVKETTGSTNDDLKLIAADSDEGAVIVAERQTSGRGRLTKSFYSPPNSGVYFSLLLKPQKGFSVAEYLTVFAALAVSSAIEKVFNVKTNIKWVNDVYVDDKKCAGILTEAVTDERGFLKACIVGIGVNIGVPEGGFPDAIKNIAGAVSGEKADKRAEITAAILNAFATEYTAFDVPGATKRYREKSNLIGKRITVAQAGREYDATVLDIDNACRLIVSRDDGVTAALTYGDVKIIKKEN